MVFAIVRLAVKYSTFVLLLNFLLNSADGKLLPHHRKYLSVGSYFIIDHLLNFKVTDRQSFIEFINLLRQDLIDNTESWENQNLNDFLQAIDSYAEDIQGYYDNNSIDTNADKTNWHRFADILKGATIYE